jgi:hypothetical protein
MDDEEIWKPVPSLDGVQASSHGRILLPPRVARMPNGGERVYPTAPTIGSLKSATKGAKYVYRGIFNRRLGNLKVHRLVCEAFHGPCPAGMETLHRDEDALNNRPENLCWGTRKENLNAPGFKEYCCSRRGADNPLIKGRKKKK